jgi:hypothetical protein
VSKAFSCRFAALASVAVLGLVAAMSPALAGDAEDAAMGMKLAELLQAGRNVVSNYQTLINDPSLGDKQLDGERFTREALELYREQAGAALFEDGIPERDRRLLQAQLDAMREVMDEQQMSINRPGIGFKGFVPAVFARLANEKFGARVGAEAKLRVTAPEHLVRNRKSLPDEWESGIIENVFSDPQRPRGEPYTEATEVDGRSAFRMLLPEYYTQSCLSCHGEPKDEVDVTGYPKEGGKEGDLGGAISIVLFR